MQGSQTAYLVAAKRMSAAARALEATVKEAASTQTRHDDCVRKLIDLVKTRSDKWDATARAALASLSGKQSVLSRKLARLRLDIEAAQSAYDREVREFGELSDLFEERIRREQSETRRLRRRESALCRTIDQTVFDFHPGRGATGFDDTGFRLPEESHGYIALEIPRFLNLLIHLDGFLKLDPDYAKDDGKRYHPVSFLEVGCGQGRNLLITRNSQIVEVDRIAGFDLNPGMVEGGNKRLGLGDTLFVQDALEYDYGDFDVVFSYRPIAYNPVMQQLEERMAATMRTGAYLLAPYPLDLSRYPEMTQVSDGVEIWKKTG